MTYLHFKVFIVYRDASLKTLQFVPNVLKQTNYKMSFKTLGTSVINSPLSPLSLFSQLNRNLTFLCKASFFFLIQAF